MSRLVPAATALSLALLVIAVPAASAQEAAEESRGPWLHVRVADGQGQESVNMNVPLAVVALVLQMGDVQSNFDALLSERDLTAADLRKTWSELRAVGDGDLMVSEDAKESVRVRLEGGNLNVTVTERASGEPRATAVLPGRVVDALLAGDGARIDVAQALRSLGDAGLGDLLTATDGTEQTVRVWID